MIELIPVPVLPSASLVLFISKYPSDTAVVMLELLELNFAATLLILVIFPLNQFKD